MIKYNANQDIRDYMADHMVSQRTLGEAMGVSVWSINKLLKEELPEATKEDLIRRIDAIVTDRNGGQEETEETEEPQEAEEETAESEAEESEEETEEETQSSFEDASVTTRFQIGDRVKLPSKALTIGTVADIWHSLVQDKVMYAVDTEGGTRGLYAENQLEPAPKPITYTFEAHIDGNVAVAIMNAEQDGKKWIYARGHAHIIHDGEVGMAQAISYAARRMFESLDTKQKNRIYSKEDK